MKNINNLFFELIQVAIGTRVCLSHTPSADEWGELYAFAKKQSLVGVCFAGVQKTLSSFPLKGEDPSVVGMPEMLYLTWMGMAAKIQQKNEVLNRQCVDLQKRLAADGFRSCILKGQAVAVFYRLHDNDDDTPSINYKHSTINLSLLRQSGDIDVWVDGDRESIIRSINKVCPTDDISYLHARFDVFDDTEVELHFTPSVASGRKTNKKLQKWFENRKNECMTNQVGTFTTPTKEFNVVYLLHHIFRHYLYEGIGLRQMLDYYFTLVAYANVNTSTSLSTSSRELSANLSVNYSCGADEVLCALKDIGLIKFTGAVMYVMREVFGMDEKSMIYPVDVKRGRRLLEVIMEDGNFGHSTEKYKITGWDKPWSRLSRYVRRNWFMLWDYPDEILSNVLGKIKS